LHPLAQAALAALLAAQLGACATVLEGTSQAVTINTGAVADVDCTLTSPAFGSRSLKAPGVVTLEKSKHNVQVACKKEGYHDGQAVITSHFAAAAAGNILFGLSGIVIGGVVDAASGAGNKYDSQVTVVMAAKPDPAPTDPKRARRTTRAQPKEPPPPPPPSAKPEPAAAEQKPQPKCSEVGGYEAYKQRTGEVCRL
jgi:hypothetical protein